MKFVLYALLAWFAYQFIFKLVIPVYRTSRKIKKGFREMHERMQAQQQNQAQPGFTNNSSGPKAAKPDSRDYIDFEEIK